MIEVLLVLVLAFLVLVSMSWAAPTPTARQDPVDFKIENGHRSLFTFAADPNLDIWEIEVGQPGIDGGEPVDTTTQHNDTKRTFSPRTLQTDTPFDITFAYGGATREQIQALVNVRTTGTNTLPDGTTIAFYCFLQKVEFDPLVEGEMPTGTATIVPTNYDPVNRVEEGPAVNDVAGT